MYAATSYPYSCVLDSGDASMLLADALLTWRLRSQLRGAALTFPAPARHRHKHQQSLPQGTLSAPTELRHLRPASPPAYLALSAVLTRGCRLMSIGPGTLLKGPLIRCWQTLLPPW